MMFSAAASDSCTDVYRALVYELFAAFIVLLIGVVECVSARPPQAAPRPANYIEKTIYSFCSVQNCTDGSDPGAALLYKSGKLYGATAKGGLGCQNFGCGTVFSVDPDTEAETVLYTFCNQEYCADGANPLSSLISWKGALFGTTTLGGTQTCSGGCGTVFRVDLKTGAEKVLYAFCKQGNCDDGQDPLSGVIEVGGCYSELRKTVELARVSARLT